MTDDLVTIEHHDDGIAVVTMNRPERLNALAPEMCAGIIDAFRSLHRRRGTRVAILNGAGRGFCAGADLTGGDEQAPDAAERTALGVAYRTQQQLVDAILAVHECSTPVIAAVHGAAVGGGLALALACDLRVATRDATFGAVFHNIGLSGCDVGVSYFLPRLVPPTIAAELMLTGRHFSGEEAQQLGLLNHLVGEGDGPLSAAMTLAAQITANSEYGVELTKSGFWLSLDAPSLRHVVEMENRQQVLGTFTGNMQEGMHAFFEKRPPDWKGF